MIKSFIDGNLPSEKILKMFNIDSKGKFELLK